MARGPVRRVLLPLLLLLPVSHASPPVAGGAAVQSSRGAWPALADVSSWSFRLLGLLAFIAAAGLLTARPAEEPTSPAGLAWQQPLALGGLAEPLRSSPEPAGSHEEALGAWRTRHRQVHGVLASMAVPFLVSGALALLAGFAASRRFAAVAADLAGLTIVAAVAWLYAFQAAAAVAYLGGAGLPVVPLHQHASWDAVRAVGCWLVLGAAAVAAILVLFGVDLLRSIVCMVR